MSAQSHPSASYSFHVFSGDAFRVTSGANLGDALGDPEELTLGDIYRMDSEARALQLAVSDAGSAPGEVMATDRKGHRIADGSELGKPGATLHLAARMTFLAPEGHKVDLLLIALPGRNYAALPLDPIEPGRDHTLIGVDAAPTHVRLADITSVALARGTLITLADGRQRPIEELEIGDTVLTRDRGPQPIRWVLNRTLRAVGPHAPVVIPKDMMGNAADLILSQNQRLFVYQRGEDRLTDTAEMLVRAGHLVDDENVLTKSGGYVDYFTLIFDAHEVIYAECIPVESLQVNAATLGALPEDMAAELGQQLPRLDQAPHYGTEASKDALAAAKDRILKGGDSG